MLSVHTRTLVCVCVSSLMTYLLKNSSCGRSCLVFVYAEISVGLKADLVTVQDVCENE